MDKFVSLKRYLINSGKDDIFMTFKELENVIGFPLPRSAWTHKAYFANTETHSISKAWMEAGYVVSELNIYEGKLAFKKRDISKAVLLSTDVMASSLKGAEIQEKNKSVSIFSLCELLSTRGFFEKEVSDYVITNKITIVDSFYKRVSYDSFSEKSNNIKAILRNIYNSVIKYTLLCCLVNAYSKDKIIMQNVFSFFERDGESNLLIDFPLTSDTSISKELFKNFIKNIIPNIDVDLTYSETIKKIANLEYSTMSLINISGLDNLKTNYCNYALKRFIASCKENEPYIPFYLIVEMLNVDIISARKELSYMTTKDDNYETLFGSIRNRIIRKEI